MAGAPAAPPLLRPLSAVDILDVALTLYRRNFGPFLGITAVVYVPVAALQVVGAFYMGQMMGTQGPGEQTAWVPIAMSFGFMLAAMAVYLLTMPICHGALSVAVARRYLGQPVTAPDAYQYVGARWGVLLATALLYWTIVMVGSCACYIPGVFLLVLFMFAAPAVVIEGQSVLDALRRSQELVRDHWWRCFGTYLLLGLITGAVTYAVALPIGLLSMLPLAARNPALAQAVNQGIGMAVQVFVQPIQVIGVVLMYYDLRVRQEGFDLELLARSLGTTVSPDLSAKPLVAGYGTPPPPPPPAPTPGVALPPRLEEELGESPQEPPSDL
jgi:hypothetical protein